MKNIIQKDIPYQSLHWNTTAQNLVWSTFMQEPCLWKCQSTRIIFRKSFDVKRLKHSYLSYRSKDPNTICPQHYRTFLTGMECSVRPSFLEHLGWSKISHLFQWESLIKDSGEYFSSEVTPRKQWDEVVKNVSPQSE